MYSPVWFYAVIYRKFDKQNILLNGINIAFNRHRLHWRLCANVSFFAHSKTFYWPFTNVFIHFRFVTIHLCVTCKFVNFNITIIFCVSKHEPEIKVNWQMNYRKWSETNEHLLLIEFLVGNWIETMYPNQKTFIDDTRIECSINDIILHWHHLCKHRSNWRKLIFIEWIADCAMRKGEKVKRIKIQCKNINKLKPVFGIHAYFTL